jgi:hypothetical protein
MKLFYGHVGSIGSAKHFPLTVFNKGPLGVVERNIIPKILSGTPSLSWDASRVSRGSVADHAGRSATTWHENLRSIGPGQHEFVNGGAREPAGVCKRRVGVKEID